MSPAAAHQGPQAPTRRDPSPALQRLERRSIATLTALSLLVVALFGIADTYIQAAEVRWTVYGLMVLGITLLSTMGLFIVRPNVEQAQAALEEERQTNLEIARTAQERLDAMETYAFELEQSNEDLQRFAHVASHDLQEPIRSVASYLQLLEQRYTDDLDDEAREYMGYAVDGAHRMRSLIRGLLAYSKVGGSGDALGTVDLDEALDDALENLRVSLDESDATVHRDPLPDVYGDRVQLTQVFQNLISNAIKFSGDAPPGIRVWADDDGDRWVVNVQDDGIGFDASSEHRLFDIFQRADHEREGSGVGLAVCQRILDRHRGKIWADAEPGEGATFRFTLLDPIDHEPEAIPNGPPSPPETLEERFQELI